MSVNLATKYSGIVDEKIRNGVLSTPGVNNDYDFIGARSVKVYTFSPVAMNDYSTSGTSRYGSPSELEDTLQEMTLSQAKSFTFTIDKINAVDSPEGVRDAGKALARQISQAVIPMLDTYRFGKIVAGAGSTAYTAVTKSNAYEKFIDANNAISNKDVPIGGRVAFCSPSFLGLLKQDSSFVKGSDLGQKALFNGQVGEVDGVAIIQVPETRLPVGLAFVITNPSACCAPVKLEDYKLHEDAPGIAGTLVEGLIYHDAFVLNGQKDGIAAHYGTLGALTFAGTASTTSGKTDITVTGKNGIVDYYYKVGSSAVTPPALGAGTSGYTKLAGLTDTITPGSGNTHCVVCGVDGNGKVIAASGDTTIAIGA